MLSVAKQVKKLCWPALLTGMLVFPGCENDLKKVKEISSQQLNLNVDTVHGVDVIFSDSAKVKFHVLAPLLLQYNTKTPYKLMPKTVNVLIYDNLVQDGSIIADTGLQTNGDKEIEFKKNVVAKNAKGDVFRSDELIWDQTTKTIHSNKLVHIVTYDGNVMDGTSFQSDDKMKHWTVKQSTGIFNVSGAPTQ